MPFVTRKSMIAGSMLIGAAVAVAGGFVWSGVYNIGADDAHTKPVYATLQLVRDRSITARARKLHPPPNLDDPALIRQGAGNYNAMCIACHLSPGMAATELSKGLYPSPPDLTKADVGDPSHHFWVIKHGIKASGMPAWGKSMSDEYVWNMVAFLRVLPDLNAEQYKVLVASSAGHSHGGGETKPHHDGEGVDMGTPGADASKAHVDAPGAAADHHRMPASGKPASKSTADTVEHRHADGTVESHPAPQPAPVDDGHEH